MKKKPSIRTISLQVSGEQVKATKRVLKALKQGDGFSAQDGDIMNELAQLVVDVYEGRL